MNNLELKNKLLIYYSKEQLVNIIIQALEYIEDNMSYVVKGNKEYIPTGEDLLDILRGNDEKTTL